MPPGVLPPALPWAAPSEEQPKEAEERQGDGASGSEQEEDSMFCFEIEPLGLALGQQIEVLWKVEQEGGDSCDKWYKASIHAKQSAPSDTPMAAADGGEAWGGPSAGAVDGEAGEESAQPQHIYTLRYEADEDFEAHSCDVAFLGDHWLHDMTTSGDLPYRKIGDAWEPDHAENEEQHVQRLRQSQRELLGLDEAGGVVRADGTYVVRRLSDAERSRNMEQLAKDLGLPAMEPVAQRIVAAGIGDFLDAIQDMVASKEPGAIVQPEDVQEMMKGLNAKRARRQ